uniref:Uncharacterized protein n=1 Tax=Fagus sylvatica TaxID=28930 RepID=A0A2N9F5U4_FAGSY
MRGAVTVLRELWYCHVADLIHSRSSSKFLVRVPFFIRFSGAVLEVFRNSKWVMRHIVGKLSTSSFQRYKVCTNRSSDEGVMAPGSRGIGAVFVHSSGEDSGQTGDAIGEPRVPRRSRSHYLSNAPGLADQLVASRKDSAREGGSCAAYFLQGSGFAGIRAWTLVRYGPANRGHRGVFGPFEGSFPIRIPADPDKILGDPRVPRRAWMCLLSNVPGLADQLVASQEDSVRKRGNVGGKIPEISAQPYFVGLFSRAWGGQFDSSFLVWSTVRSNLGQTLVKLGRIWSKLSKLLEMYPGLHVSKGFWARYCEKSSSFVSFSVRRAGSQPVDTRVKSLGRFQILGFLKTPFFLLLLFLLAQISRSGSPFALLRDGLAWVTTQVSNRGRIGLGDHPGLETETNRGRIGLGDHPGLETKFVIRVRIGLGDHPGLETETNRGRIGLGDHPGLETKFVIRVRIGLGDHPGLETETNRGRIGLGDHPGLETKFVIRVRIGLGDHPGLETETNRGRIGLGDHPGLETKFVIRVRIGLGDHPGLETETNRGRIGLGDHPGLETKFVIRVRIGLGDHPGLETETNRGRIGLGDHPGLETKFVIRVRIGLGDHPGLETETNRGRIGLGDHPVYLAFLALGLPVALSYRCLTEVVVAEIVAGPHVLDSCECMNIEDAMRASLRWLLLCLLGRSALASHTLGLAISQVGLSNALDHLVRRHFLNLRSAWLNLRLFQLIPDGGSTSLISGLSSNFSGSRKNCPSVNSLFPGFDTITDLGDSARGVHSPG